MGWLGRRDHELPTWAHTLLVMAIVAFFAMPLLWAGFEAVASGELQPMMGPEFGQWWFGSQPLHDRAAVLAGWSLLCTGLAFLALGLANTRLAQGSLALKALPVACFVLAVLLGSKAMA